MTKGILIPCTLIGNLVFFFSAIFLQQCHFLRQTGHSEKALALFQALIDFTFLKPDNVKNLSTREQVTM